MKRRTLRVAVPALLAGLTLAGSTLVGCAPDAAAARGADGGAMATGDYLGQTPPGDRAELFAPGLVNAGYSTRDVAMTPDGSELYWGVLVGGRAVIMESHREDGRWTAPEVAPFSRDPRVLNLEPHITPDGRRFLFLSTRPRDGEPADTLGGWEGEDIWVMDREGDAWGEPYNPGPPVNSDAPEFFPSVTNDGTLYFTRGGDGATSRIFRARPAGDGWAEPEPLPPAVNSTPSQFNGFIAPDESYLLFATDRRADTRGGIDYYVCFRHDDDTWSEPVNLGDRVNSALRAEMSAFVSRDGRYLFFMAPRRPSLDRLPDTLTARALRALHDGPWNGNPGIWWIEAGFIEELRPPR